MSKTRKFIGYFAASALVLMYSTSIVADSKTRHVIELFTSQGCYSCPPAEELLGRVVSEHDDVLALEFHVDYWNNLVYGSAGKWQDPFSSARFSQRQRNYQNLNLDGRTGVYTPQMVVNGNFAAVGSRSSVIRKQIAQQSSLPLSVSASLTGSNTVSIEVSGMHDDIADVWLVSYDRKHVTDIPSGENKGKTLANHNVVRSLEPVGKWKGDTLEISVDDVQINENQHCAVIVQKSRDKGRTVAGPILGAANCEIS